MILAVFGTVYAVCLAILAITLLSAKPLAPSGGGPSKDRSDAPPQRHGAERARDLAATHH
jgi:hypothetical protein